MTDELAPPGSLVIDLAARRAAKLPPPQVPEPTLAEAFRQMLRLAESTQAMGTDMYKSFAAVADSFQHASAYIRSLELRIEVLEQTLSV